MITIAVTGGIGAGKTETVNILERLGAETIKADLLGHMAYAKGTPGFAEVVEAFGNGVVAEDGEIDRKALGGIVFSDPKKRRKLESIVWVRIRDMITDMLADNAANGVGLTVLEAAVLFEAGWEDLADNVWTVESSYHQRLARISKSTGMPEHEAQRRINAQINPDIRIRRADETICNDGDLAQLERRVTKLWEMIATQ